jgi:hypothetical protein
VARWLCLCYLGDSRLCPLFKGGLPFFMLITGSVGCLPVTLSMHDEIWVLPLKDGAFLL